MDYVIAFLVGGTICAVGQYILDTTKLTPAHLLVLFTVIGAVLSGLGIYDKLLDFAGAGALIPVSGFGASIARGAYLEAQRLGWVGLFTGALEFTGLGVVAAVLFGFIISLVATPKA